MKKMIFTLGLVTAFGSHALSVFEAPEETAGPLLSEFMEAATGGRHDIPFLFIGSGDGRGALPLTPEVLSRYGAEWESALSNLMENERKPERAGGPVPTGIKICSAETVNFLLSGSLLLPGEKIAADPFLLGVGIYYGVCSLAQIGQDRMGNRVIIYPNDVYANGNQALSYLIDLICLPVLAVNRPLAWLIFGEESGRTPYYKP